MEVNYKEKYEQALKRAKAVLELAANEEEAEGYVSTIFPELKESEEERTRKAIIRYLKDRLKTSPSIPAAIGSWIAWLEKQGEQKPAWSEKDERCRKTLLHLLEHYSILTSERESCISWLKSLRPQPKYEWTEKDEINRDLIYNALNHVYDLEHNKSLCDWLNSLRPQNHWKPSDEQINELGKHCPDNTISTSLYEQLKKL